MEQELIDQIIDEISVDDLPNKDLRELAEIIGIEPTVRMMCHWAGLQVWVPMSGLRTVQQRYVQRYFDGTNAGQLARRLGVTQRTIERYAQTKTKGE